MGDHDDSMDTAQFGLYIEQLEVAIYGEHDAKKEEVETPPEPEKLPDDQQTLASVANQIEYYLRYHMKYVYCKIPNKRWNLLGDMIKKAENGSTEDIDGTKWISLRLDGHGFGKKIKKLKELGVLEQNYSKTFSEVMAQSLKELMKNWDAVIGYTQSDELSLLIPPVGFNRLGKMNHHQYSGRHDKLISSCAADMTSQFITNLIKITDVVEKSPNLVHTIMEVHMRFDCRVASYQSFDEAKGVLLWRGQDNFKNGINDHMYHLYANKPQYKEIMGSHTEKKIDWLFNKLEDMPGKLAMHGSWFVREKVEKRTINQKTKQEVVGSRIQYNPSSLKEILQNPNYAKMDCPIPNL